MAIDILNLLFQHLPINLYSSCLYVVLCTIINYSYDHSNFTIIILTMNVRVAVWSHFHQFRLNSSLKLLWVSQIEEKDILEDGCGGILKLLKCWTSHLKWYPLFNYTIMDPHVLLIITPHYTRKYKYCGQGLGIT